MGNGERVIGVVVVSGEEVVIREGGGEGTRKKSFVKGIEVEIGDDIFGIDSIRMGQLYP